MLRMAYGPSRDYIELEIARCLGFLGERVAQVSKSREMTHRRGRVGKREAGGIDVRLTD